MAFSGPPLPITPINTFTTGEQTHSSIAGLAGGGYVVTWTSAAQDGSSGGIYAQIFDANGAAVGVELLINTTTALNQDFAEVAALTGGGYVIALNSEGQDGSFTGVYLQQFDAAGVAVGGEVTVATMAVNHSPLLAHLTELASGRIGVTWSDMFGATLSDDPYF